MAVSGGVRIVSVGAPVASVGHPEAVALATTLGAAGLPVSAHGAVSAPGAEAMVRGVCARSGAACGLAITGIAGLDEGTPTKPVGTVFIGLAFQGDVAARRFRFDGDRTSVKWQSSVMALDMLRRRLLR